MLSDKFYVYEWISEKDGVFYVGKGSADRAFRKPNKKQIYLYNLCKKREKQGIEIEKKIVKRFSEEEDAYKYEKKLIIEIRPKCNLSLGGRGGSFGYKHSEENKKKIAEAAQGATHMCGKKLSKETCQKISQSNKGHVVSKETRQKISAALTGKSLSEKHKIKLKGNKNALGAKRTEEYKIYLSESRLGENNPVARLTAAQVKEIRKKYKPYEYTQKKLAKEYNVSAGCIQGIVDGVNWKQ